MKDFVEIKSRGVVHQFAKILGYASGLLRFFQLADAAASANFVGLVTQGIPDYYRGLSE